MFVITLSDILGLAILAVILVGCIAYWLYSKRDVAKYEREYHAPKTAKAPAKTDNVAERLEALKKSDPVLYKKARRKLLAGYILIFGAFITLCLFLAWFQKR